jgi:hypothetical protein
MRRETQRKRSRGSIADLLAGSRRSARALHVLCCCVVLGVLSLSAPARADAPMCDRVGASVDAPPDVPPARSGSVEELPCGNEEMLSLLEQGVPKPRHDAFKQLDVHPQRAWMVVHAILLRAPSERCPAPAADEFAPMPGHPRPVYRPPLAS